MNQIPAPPIVPVKHSVYPVNIAQFYKQRHRMTGRTFWADEFRKRRNENIGSIAVMVLCIFIAFAGYIAAIWILLSL